MDPHALLLRLACCCCLLRIACGSSSSSSLITNTSSSSAWLTTAAAQMDATFPVLSNPHTRSWPALAWNDWRVIVGSLVAFVGAMLSNAAGIGGGGLFVPMFRLLIGFDVKTSAALSKSMIMGGAVMSALYNLRRKHPALDKPLIDYDVALLIQPMLLLGISFGVMCNVMFPDWMLTLLLIVVLIGMAYKSFKKGLCTWCEETSRKEESFCDYGSLSADEDSRSCDKSMLEQGLLGDAPAAESAFSWEVLKWTNIGILCCVWVLFFTIQYIKAGAETCGTLYWLLNAAQIPVSLLVTVLGIWRLQQRRVKGSPQAGWKLQQVLVYPLSAVMSGMVGGLLGIGGGMILAPLFLELGIIPQVASATTTFIVVFSSSMSVVEFHLLGRLPSDYALYFSILCALSALVGLRAARYFVRKYGRASIIIFILSFIIALSALVLGLVGGIEDLNKFLEGEYMGFRSLCE